MGQAGQVFTWQRRGPATDLMTSRDTTINRGSTEPPDRRRLSATAPLRLRYAARQLNRQG